MGESNFFFLFDKVGESNLEPQCRGIRATNPAIVEQSYYAYDLTNSGQVALVPRHEPGPQIRDSGFRAKLRLETTRIRESETKLKSEPLVWYSSKFVCWFSLAISHLGHRTSLGLVKSFFY